MKGTGYIPSPKDLRNYKINKVCMVSKLPAKYEAPHSRIKDQKNVGSCVAFSTSSVLETKYGKDYSTAWIYGYRPDGYYQGIGMCVLDALKTIYKKGFVEERELKGNYEMQKAKEVVDYYLGTNPDIKNKTFGYAELHNINEIKQAIYMTGLPVLVSCDVDNLQYDENYVVYIPQDTRGGHQMVCYGWNETGLLIQNSWGEEFGNKGTIILPYNYPITEAWMIRFEKPEEPKPIEPKPDVIVKPKWYWLRDLIMYIVKLFRRFKK